MAVTIMLGIVIALVPSVFATVFLIVNGKESWMFWVGSFIILASITFSTWLSIWVLYPFFSDDMVREDEELPVLSKEEALRTYFAV